MQLGVLSLLVAGLAFLVLGLMTGSTPLVLASIGTSLLAVYVLVRVRREQQASAAAVPAAGGGQRKTPENARVGATAPAVATSPVSASAPGAPAHAVPAPAKAEPVATDPAEGDTTRSMPVEALPADTAQSDVEQSDTQQTGQAATGPAETGPLGPISPAPAEDDDPATPDPAAADTDPPLRSRGDEPVWVIDGRPRYHLPHCGFLLGRQPEPVPLRQAFEDGFTPCALCDPDSGLTAG